MYNLVNYNQRLANFFDDFWSDSIERNRSPKLDVNKTDVGYEIVAELPGVQEDEVKVTLEHGILTISVDQQDEKKDKVYSERKRYVWNRTLRVGNEIDSEKIDANLKNGILTVQLPLGEKAIPKQIPVKT